MNSRKDNHGSGSALVTAAIRRCAVILGKTWKYKSAGAPLVLPSFHTPAIYAFWHEYILPLTVLLKDRHLSAIVSRHKDGRRIAAILRAWNYAIIHGSSKRRGMTAIRESIRHLKQGKSLLITVDGPRGPRRVVKKGVAQISLLSKAPIIPIQFFPRNLWRLRSWDRFAIPKPFTEIDVRFGAPLNPAWGDKDPHAIDVLVRSVQHALDKPHEDLIQ